MTPVIWNGSEWIEATNAEDPYEQNWYNYNNKQWANAVTNDCTVPGDYDTCSMWVWIPRYAYQIQSSYHTLPAGTIDVVFLSGTTNTAVNGTAIVDVLSDGQTSADVHVKHPAFTFGSNEVTGIWIAKFQASVADQNDACYINRSSTDCNKASIAPKFMPNARAWTYVSIANAYAASLNIKTNISYGLNSSTVDTHMMKNSEWGAVAYLSKSKYGKETEEIWINNCSQYITGYAGNSVSEASACQNTYDSETGFNASTTGTIYGVYDMSGLTWEYVMANYSSLASDSGLNLSTVPGKYIDIYTSYGNTLGGAVYETSRDYDEDWGSWYSDYSWFSNSTNPWLYRGERSSSTSAAGIYAFRYAKGAAGPYASFRSVIMVGSGL